MHVDGVMKTKPRPVDEAKQGHVSFFNDGDCKHRQTVRINPALNLLDAPPPCQITASDPAQWALHVVNTAFLRVCFYGSVIQDLMPHK